MSEIEKLYENAGFKKDLPINLAYLDFSEEDCDELCLDNSCDECRYKTYPPFTAEKQIELIKIIANRECFVANYVPKRDIFILSSEDYCGTQIKFSDALAELINNLWQDLTEEEKQQVKGILE